MKRQEHTVNSKRHVSPSVLYTDCCGESINAAATPPICNVISSAFHRKFFGNFLKKWSILTSTFFGLTLTPPSIPLGGFLGQLADVIVGGSSFKLTGQLACQAVTCQVISFFDLKTGRRRGWKVNLTSATCQVPLGFWFLVCNAATQLATPLHQRRIQVVRSNKVARKCLTKSNGTPAMDLLCTNASVWPWICPFFDY